MDLPIYNTFFKPTTIFIHGQRRGRQRACFPHPFIGFLFRNLLMELPKKWIFDNPDFAGFFAAPLKF
jgi:hypothetical protein